MISNIIDRGKNNRKDINFNVKEKKIWETYNTKYIIEGIFHNKIHRKKILCKLLNYITYFLVTLQRNSKFMVISFIRSVLKDNDALFLLKNNENNK